MNIKNDSYTVTKTKYLKGVVYIVSSMNRFFPFRWFLFRENGVEIEIDIVGKTIKTSHPLRDYEMAYVKQNLI